MLPSLYSRCQHFRAITAAGALVAAAMPRIRSVTVERISGVVMQLTSSISGGAVRRPLHAIVSLVCIHCSCFNGRIFRLIFANSFASSLASSSCPQILITCHPCPSNVLVTSRSRFLFASSFFFQNALLLAGRVPCFGHPCQKQPSTKTATRTDRKTKSGLPNIF
jgi:hypothetical protein